MTESPFPLRPPPTVDEIAAARRQLATYPDFDLGLLAAHGSPAGRVAAAAEIEYRKGIADERALEAAIAVLSREGSAVAGDVRIVLDRIRSRKAAGEVAFFDLDGRGR